MRQMAKEPKGESADSMIENRRQRLGLCLLFFYVMKAGKKGLFFEFDAVIET